MFLVILNTTVYKENLSCIKLFKFVIVPKVDEYNFKNLTITITNLTDDDIFYKIYNFLIKVINCLNVEGQLVNVKFL